ncbi:MarR family transcriptional regulator [Actinomadura barringtoniae]|uniref:MarR family transcriptional regulator n=1 Tax=Actinomadura barringtoniae TaxID=1427535 RepID=UPI0027DD8210|nr:MarR family transcriptional regulator [Actinomadura barringtoniae]
MDRSVMVNLCDDLERSGFVRRERNPDDRRSPRSSGSEIGWPPAGAGRHAGDHA